METKTMGFDRELFGQMADGCAEYLQVGWTVCGAEDPAVIELSDAFRSARPDLPFGFVRVKEAYVSSRRSDTFFEFSNAVITDAERASYEQHVADMAD